MDVARQVGFAYELGGNADLNTMIQRGISSRTEEIKKYLIESEHRFLGSLIIAVWGGGPEYIPLTMADQENYLAGIDRQFGVLNFDGTRQYFALDGQHRLKAIKEAIKKKPKSVKKTYASSSFLTSTTRRGNAERDGCLRTSTGTPRSRPAPRI